VAEPQQVLIFKSEIQIKRQQNRWFLTHRIFPLEVFAFAPGGDASTLVIEPPWFMEPGERLIDDVPYLHRCIRSRDPKEESRYYVPSHFLRRTINV
jgi:hypothetical protein